jgi:hypothetical protein
MSRSSGAKSLSEISAGELEKLIHALLRESGTGLTMTRRGQFVDFNVDVSGPLDSRIRQRFRLYLTKPTAVHLEDLRAEAQASGLQPFAITPQGTDIDGALPSSVSIISASDLERLCNKSGVVKADTGTYVVDREALRELRDYRDPRIALLNGLIWLRPLSRDRMPPALQWTGTPAHELFEKCFFLSMISTFGCTGISWGTKARGKPIPDGRVAFRGVAATVLYDCKAAKRGYDMEYRDLTGFADYLNDPVEAMWTRPTGTIFFLVISSDFIEGAGSASFEGRRKALAKKAEGAQLVWMRAPDLAKFGLAIERAEVSHSDRSSIAWQRLLKAGNVTWTHFDEELKRLSAKGYSFA